MTASKPSDVHEGTAGVPHLKDVCSASYCGVGVTLTDAQADKLFEMAADVRKVQLDDLAEAVADMLDHALHLDTCHINPDGTYCSCVIGRIRAALPQCEHVKYGLSLHYRCLRTVHPSTPDRHLYGGEELPYVTPDSIVQRSLESDVQDAQRRDEALRELLSHCESMYDVKMAGDAWDAYGDVSNRLRSILDGEDSRVEEEAEDL